ncbi:hypothetical protein CLV35_3266 [Motilibacter peucedani]|uniref:Hemolysin type calcium-binding protein n=1 Tax=Motilibacter peucedani TaxID=598650 RepID=A0A420XMB9_9ACTN|nr:calcium-binding protein [Motilibacter peucedani]RKS71468.1 hypothetical protein CLV35_3266 [Motilibacter peucedani]
MDLRLALGATVGTLTLLTAAPAYAATPSAPTPSSTTPATCQGKTVTILGTAAGETITGTAGNDVIDAGAGDDVIDALGGNDTICGGDGKDTVSYSGAPGAVTANLATGTATGYGTDTLSTVENLTGSTYADTLTGDGYSNVLKGGSGNDRIDGAGGYDTCDAYTGTDSMNACEDVKAGTEASGALDTATFSMGSGTAFFMDNLNTSTTTTQKLTWTMKNGTAVQIPAGTPVGANNAGPFTGIGGTYTVTMSGSVAGTHHFRVVQPKTQTFTYAVGTTVSADKPTTGQGRIEGPQDTDVYTFTGKAGEKTFFDVVSDTTGGWAQATLTSPTGTQLFSRYLSDYGAVVLPTAGTYTLKVHSPAGDDHTGTYGFRIVDVPAAQKFAYSLGSTISNGVPGAGAGNLEAIGSEDDYTFTGTAGQQVYLDALTDGTAGYARAVLAAPSGATVFDRYIGSDSPVVTLPAAGTYTLKVLTSASDSHTGTYSLALRPAVSAPQVFAYTLGRTVSKDEPATGAGNLEGVGSEDDYTFSGTAGDVLFYDVLADATQGYATVTLVDPKGTTVYTGWSYTDRGGITLPTTGGYTLKVKTSDTVHLGTYSFRLLKVAAPQKFSISVGQSVSNGVPAAGAGNLEGVGSADVYTFTGTAGTALKYHMTSDATSDYGYATLRAPDGSTVLGTYIGTDSSVKPLPVTGTYTLTVAAGTNDTHTGTYGFVLQKS